MWIWDGSYEEGVGCLYLQDNGELSYISLKTSGSWGIWSVAFPQGSHFPSALMHRWYLSARSILIIKCHESAGDTQLYHLPLCFEFFPCPAVILDRDLQMGKSELPCPPPWENRMLTELLIWDSTPVCPCTEGSQWRCSHIKSWHRIEKFHFPAKTDVRMFEKLLTF